MSFWTSANFYPNIGSKFLVTIENLEGGAQFLVNSVDPLPSYSTENIGGDLNQDGTGYDPVKKQARVRWDPVTISFVNDANEKNPEQSTLFKFIQVLYDSGYNPQSADESSGTPTNDNIESIMINNQSVSRKIGGVTIQTLAPSGNPTSEYELVDPVLSAVRVSGVNYDTDNIHTFDVTFEYSHITFKTFSI
tara:strand:- start:1676 stop:2251 length:576 start_codon:yes stop_codon:yes gene_type:complete